MSRKVITIEWQEILHRKAVMEVDETTADSLLAEDDDETVLAFCEDMAEDVGYEREVDSVEVEDA
jgi:hypothetical protein